MKADCIRKTKIVKTLIIPKLTHLFISLLNPPKPMIKNYDKISATIQRY